MRVYVTRPNCNKKKKKTMIVNRPLQILKKKKMIKFEQI